MVCPGFKILTFQWTESFRSAVVVKTFLDDGVCFSLPADGQGKAGK